MKKSLLICAAFASLNSFAQQLDASNEPTIGMTQTMFVCDTLTPSYEATVGTGITWDYSDLVGLNNETQTIDVLDATTAPNAADFPTSTKAFSNQNSFTNYFSSTATERTSQGFVYEEPSFGTVLAQFNTDEQIIMNYPFAYGAYLTDAFSGSLSFTFNGIDQNPVCTGNSYAWIDGQGTLLLPYSTTVPNVIRYKIIDTVFSEVNLIVPMDIEIIRTQYEYYDVANNKLPLLTHSTFKIQQPGATTPLVGQTIVLSSVQPDAVSGLESLNTSAITFYPNPSEGLVNIKGELTANAKIQVYDQSGRIMKAFTYVASNSSIDLSDLNKGLYTLRLIDNGSITTQKVTIK